MPRKKRETKAKTFSLDLITCEYLEYLSANLENASGTINKVIQATPAFKKWKATKRISYEDKN